MLVKKAHKPVKEDYRIIKRVADLSDVKVEIRRMKGLSIFEAITSPKPRVFQPGSTASNSNYNYGLASATVWEGIPTISRKTYVDDQAIMDAIRGELDDEPGLDELQLCARLGLDLRTVGRCCDQLVRDLKIGPA